MYEDRDLTQTKMADYLNIHQNVFRLCTKTLFTKTYIGYSSLRELVQKLKNSSVCCSAC